MMRSTTTIMRVKDSNKSSEMSNWALYPNELQPVKPLMAVAGVTARKNCRHLQL